MTAPTGEFSEPAVQTMGSSENAPAVTFREPLISDGPWMRRLAAESGTLDVNSPYAYLLWCRDFSATSVVGCVGDSVACFVTGYLRPDEPDVLFVWQVATDAAHRGRGLARRALDALVDRVTQHRPVAQLEATVTPDNVASARLFASFARARDAALTNQSLFTEHDFAGADHDEEVLYRIGPLSH